MVYISTSCLSGINEKYNSDIFRVLDIYAKHGIDEIELGTSHAPISDPHKLLLLQKQFDFKYIVHGALFTKKRFFYTNLGSQDEKTLKESIAIARQSIEFCNAADSDLYSFHAPYLADFFGVDLKVVSKKYDYEAVYLTFKDTMLDLLDYAKQNSVKLAVETSMAVDANIPFYSPPEFKRLFSDIKHKNFGLLIDHGHIRYSGQVKKFDYREFYELTDRVFEMHVHKTVGLVDHQKLTDASILADFDRSLLRKIKLTLESHKLSVKDILECNKIMEDAI